MTSAMERDPIRLDWKISDVIGRYPQLVDELVALNPAFRLLKNPVARRVQSRLVTVAQAARIGGMSPEGLLSQLNASIGVESDAPGAVGSGADEANVEAPTWVRVASVVAEVDARALQRSGAEPFGPIMTAARSTEVGQVFRLRSSFEPVPLYTVMTQRGFDHWSTCHADGDWEVLFRNTGGPRETVATSARPGDTVEDTSWTSPTASITIDVSELVPPEPMVRILSALENLRTGESLLVHHVRRPIHLYPQLDDAGYRHETRDVGPGKVDLLIEKPADDR